MIRGGRLRWLGPFGDLAEREGGTGAGGATRCGVLMHRHRVCPDSMRLKVLAIPVARKPGPLVTHWRSRMVANYYSIGVVRRYAKCSTGQL